MISLSSTSDSDYESPTSSPPSSSSFTGVSPTIVRSWSFENNGSYRNDCLILADSGLLLEITVYERSNTLSSFSSPKMSRLQPVLRVLSLFLWKSFSLFPRLCLFSEALP
jgi:hypothetical protein